MASAKKPVHLVQYVVNVTCPHCAHRFDAVITAPRGRAISEPLPCVVCGEVEQLVVPLADLEAAPLSVDGRVN